MGCFSFMCKKCGKPILSNSFNGQKVKLFLLSNSKIIEEMEGPYDSYGRVFDNNMKSIEWSMSWSKVCDLMFSDNYSDGIAAIHSKCFDGILPTSRSAGDPNQGWGENFELFGDIDQDIKFD